MLNFVSSKLFDNDNLENDLSVFKAEMIFPKQNFFPTPLASYKGFAKKILIIICLSFLEPCKNS